MKVGKLLAFRPLYAAYSLLLGFLVVCLEMQIYSSVTGIAFSKLGFTAAYRPLIFIAAAVVLYATFMCIEQSEKCDRLRSMLRNPFVITLLVTVAFRLWYYSHLHTSLWYDSDGYENSTFNLFAGQIDVFRTPVYPLFIKLVGFLTGAAEGSSRLYNNIVSAQMMVSALSAYVFYCTAARLFKKNAVIVIVTLLFACSPMIISWEYCILTETLAVFAMVLMIWLIVCYIQKPTYITAVGLGLMVFFMIMLRPAYIYFFAILGVFWLAKLLLSRVETKRVLAGIAALVFSGCLALGYCALNYADNEFFGISNVGTNINKLYMVIDCEITDNPDYPQITEFIESGVINGDNIENFNLVSDVIEPANSIYEQDDISGYVNGCISKNKGAYISYQIDKFVELMQYGMVIQYSDYSRLDFAATDNALMGIFYPFNFGLTLIICALGVLAALWLFIRKKRIAWTVIGLCAIIFTHIFVSVYASMAEYARLSFLVIPAVLLLLALPVDLLLSAVDGKRLSDELVDRTTGIVERVKTQQPEL